MIYQSRWTPSQGIVRHSGQDIPQEMFFLIAPSPRIGRVISAEGTLRESIQMKSFWNKLTVFLPRAFLVGLGASFLAILIQFLSRPDASMSGINSLGFTGSIICLIALIIFATVLFVFSFYFYINFYPRCSYVGEQGIALYILKGNHSAKLETQILLFKDVTDIHVSIIQHDRRQFLWNTYISIKYIYVFDKKVGRPYKLTGWYRNERGLPEDSNNWHFANAAKEAYCSYLLSIASDQFNQQGYVEFPMREMEVCLRDNPQVVRIGNSFMEFVERDGTSERVTKAGMEDINLADGIFSFKHKDAQWLSGKGQYSFVYSNIPNVEIFLIFLEKLVGIKTDIS